MLWRHEQARDTYLPAGHVAAFNTVQALRLVSEHGLVEIRLADGGSGFIDATRLTPGDRRGGAAGPLCLRCRVLASERRGAGSPG